MLGRLAVWTSRAEGPPGTPAIQIRSRGPWARARLTPACWGARVDRRLVRIGGLTLPLLYEHKDRRADRRIIAQAPLPIAFASQSESANAASSQVLRLFPFESTSYTPKT
jgi:hypothetical protein